MGRRLPLLVAAISILLAAFVVHLNVILPRGGDEIYPWSSDTWGHLVKAEYLRTEIGEGSFYPDIFPSWYAGQQMLRYFAPLPYYLLVALDLLVGNIFVAGNLFIFLTSLGGALGFLLFAPRIGVIPAALAGIFFLLLPDNLRVAYAEGNLPRCLATALLPYAGYFFLNLLTRAGRKRDFAGATITIGLIVLSHAMMAGIFAMGFGILILSYWLVTQAPFQVPTRAAIALVAGLLIAGWWLFPSLTGGITEIDQAAASEAIATFPMNVAFNPVVRSGDREIFYVGLVLFGVSASSLVFWRQLPPWQRALTATGLAMSLIASTLVNDLWKALPLSNLLWPMRFMSFAGFALVLSAAAFVGFIYRTYGARVGSPGRVGRFAAAGLVILVFLDSEPSLSLASSREEPSDVVRIARELPSLQGWRVATADLSRLGSAPAQLFTSVGGREQVFGWAFQGSTIAPLLAQINEAMVRDHSRYAISRFGRLGADDVVVAPIPEIGVAFLDELRSAGYEVALTTPSGALYHRDGAPRAAVPRTRVFGIGSGANNAAYLFPEITVGSSSAVDSYELAFLNEFDVLVLSRFTFANRGRAEDLIREYAEGGKHVVVDLTGAPLDSLARQPRFLGVYGEPALGIKRAVLNIDGTSRSLRPFPERVGDLVLNEWRGAAVQGAQEEITQFDYPATKGVLIGRNYYGQGHVEFIGLNLMFHAAITKDPLAIEILERSTGLKAFEAPHDENVPLDGYVASDRGYRFSVDLERAAWVLFPFGHVDGTVVKSDGVPVPVLGAESLILAQLPAGRSDIEITIRRTGVYWMGRMATILGMIILLTYASPLVKPLPASAREARA